MAILSFLKSFKVNTRVVSSAALAFTCLASAAAYYLRSRKTEINEVMIFCKLQYNAFNYFDKLLDFLESAKHSIYVCMPTIHSPAIQGRLLEMIEKKNVKVRIVIDGDGYNGSTATFLEELTEAGAEIKWKPNDSKIYHRFCLVDGELLMTGTLDWGNDLSMNNWNYVYITNQNHLVTPVVNEFQNMWNDVRNKLLIPWDYESEEDRDPLEPIVEDLVQKTDDFKNQLVLQTVDTEWMEVSSESTIALTEDSNNNDIQNKAMVLTTDNIAHSNLIQVID